MNPNLFFIKWQHGLYQKRAIQLFIYTLIFTALFFMVTLVLFVNGKSFVETTDSVVLRFPATEYGRRYLLHLFSKGSILQWDWNVGYGSNPLMDLTGLSELTDPFYLVTLFFSRATEQVFALLIFLRLYCAGLAFFLLSKKRGNTYLPSLCGSLVYCFTAYVMIFGTKHPCFILPMIWLPIVWTGIEQVLENKTPFWLTLGVMLSAISSVYFFCMIVLMTVLYTVIRVLYLSPQKQRLKSLFHTGFRTILWALLGVGIAAVTLIPSIIGLLSSSRESSGNLKLNFNGFLFNTLKGFINLYLVSWSSLCAVVVILPLTALLIFSKRKYGDYKWLFATVLVISASDLLRSMFNGMSFPTYRWIFYAMLILGLITATVLTNTKSLSARDYTIMLISLGIIILASSACIILRCFFERSSFITIGVSIFMITVIRVFPKFIKTAPNTDSRLWVYIKEKHLALLFLVFIFTCAAMNGYFTYSEKYKKAARNYIDAGSVDAYYGDGVEALYNSLGKDSFYRVDTQKYCAAASNGQTRDNASLALGFHGITSAKSVIDSDLYKFYEMSQVRGTINGCEYTGVDDRAALGTLVGVKYFLAYDGVQSVIPYGYEPIKRQDKFTVYQNKYDLGLAYAYDSYMLESDLYRLYSPKRENAMLKSVSLAEAPTNRTAYLPADPSYTTLSHSIKSSQDVEIYPDRFVSKKSGSSITISASGTKGKELYVVLENLRFQSTSAAKDLSIEMMTDSVFKKHKYTAEGSNYYVEDQPDIYNLGYQQNDSTEITIAFTAKGTLKFDSFKIIAPDMGEYEKAAGSLMQNKLQNVKITNETLDGSIKRDKDGILFTSIPYAQGWSATVNGKKADIMRANIGFSAVALGKSENVVHFEYHSPYLKTSIAISLFNLLLFIAAVFLKRRIKI